MIQKPTNLSEITKVPSKEKSLNLLETIYQKNIKSIYTIKNLSDFVVVEKTEETSREKWTL